MRPILFAFILLSAPLRAQMNTLPENVNDEPTANDLAYLSTKLNYVTAQVSTLNGVAVSSISASSTMTWTAPNTFTTTVNLSSAVVLGDPGQVNLPKIFAYMTSIDGTTRNAGCVGIWSMSGNTASSFATWTSTNSSAQAGSMAVLTATCVPSSICLFQIFGPALVTAVSNTNQGDFFDMSSTYCQPNDTNGAGAGSASGQWLTTRVGSGLAWLSLHP